MSRGRSRSAGRRLVRVGYALIGALTGAVAFLVVASNSPDPMLVQATVIRPNRAGAGSELSVQVLGRPAFTKSSSDPEAYSVEGWLWATGPDLTLALLVVGIGGYVGWRLGRRRRPPTPDAEVADYKDSTTAAPPSPVRRPPRSL